MSERFFNTAGPCIEGMHYMIPAVQRLPEAPKLVARLGCFVLHAPRQTGKTTTLRALAKQLTAQGSYAALTFSCEDGGAWGEDIGAAQRALLGRLRRSADSDLPVELRPPEFAFSGDEGLVDACLSAWARACPRPLALFFDEIDALRGASLVSVLRQLRAGYPSRPAGFPASVALCGLRDVRDYKAKSGGDPERLGTASPFNIKIRSLRIGDFSEHEVRELYGQHTEDTGQIFSEAALHQAWLLTAGQPWLVNALAAEVVEQMQVPKSETITAEHIDTAKERLIQARQTHLDSLSAKLHEPRVLRVIQPVIMGTMAGAVDSYNDDIQYCRDLGLLAMTNPVRIANPIYREVIVRVLAAPFEARVFAEPKSFVLSNGRLDFHRLLVEFGEFWREHGEVLTAGMSYHEVAPQLVLMAFMQRIVNGGGHIDREYGIGRERIDLLVRWPYRDGSGTRVVQREAVEIKLWRDRDKDPLDKGLEQLDAYLERLAMDEGTLVIFDRRSVADAHQPVIAFEPHVTASGRAVTVMRA